MHYVYALRDAVTGAIKIGRSCTPDGRKIVLENGLHRNLETIRLYAYESYDAHLCVEHYLHAKLKTYKHPAFRGKEWYLPDVEPLLPKHVNSKFAMKWLYINNKPTVTRCRRAWSVRLGRYVMVYKDSIVDDAPFSVRNGGRAR